MASKHSDIDDNLCSCYYFTVKKVIIMFFCSLVLSVTGTILNRNVIECFILFSALWRS